MSAKSISEYIRRHDVERFGALGPNDRYADEMLDPGEWTGNSSIRYIQTPPGVGSTRGLHTHSYDQVYFIVKGTMEIEIEGSGRELLYPGDVVVFPAGRPHQSWNNSDEVVIHLAMNGGVQTDEPS